MEYKIEKIGILILGILIISLTGGCIETIEEQPINQPSYQPDTDKPQMCKMIREQWSPSGAYQKSIIIVECENCFESDQIAPSGARQKTSCEPIS